MHFKIKAKQDFIFFGIPFVEKWTIGKPLEFDWLVRDGEMVLQNQTCCLVSCEKNVSLKKLLDFLSYLSGAATLVRCFAQHSSVPVVASPTATSSSNFSEKEKNQNSSSLDQEEASPSKEKPSPSLAYWEEQAIKAGGGVIKPELPTDILHKKETLKEKYFKNQKKLFCLNMDSMNLSQIESIIKELPEKTPKGIYGSFKPENCKKLSTLSLQFLWPKWLQGHFPRVQITQENIYH